ncbi:MAG: HAD-IA family hydrolase [Bacteroidales bacterium]|nr:HAD-IA family hydrolase [Bacteroidales bacterium]
MARTHLFFDLDGTIINSFQGISNCVCYALQYLGITVENKNDLLPFIGPPLTFSFKEYYHLNQEQINIAVAKYRERYAVDGILENELYPDIESALQQMVNKGYKLYIATSKPQVFAGQILKYLHVYHYFTYVGGSDMAGRLQSKADVINEVLSQNGISANQVWMIGDRKYDVEGAHAVQVPCVGVLYGFGNRKELQECACDVIVETVNDLKNFFCKELVSLKNGI